MKIYQQKMVLLLFIETSFVNVILCSQAFTSSDFFVFLTKLISLKEKSKDHCLCQQATILGQTGSNFPVREKHSFLQKTVSCWGRQRPNLSVHLKSTVVTSWKINNIGGERKVGTEKERNKRGEGIEQRERSEGLEGWGLLTITTSSP